MYLVLFTLLISCKKNAFHCSGTADDADLGAGNSCWEEEPTIVDEGTV